MLNLAQPVLVRTEDYMCHVLRQVLTVSDVGTSRTHSSLDIPTAMLTPHLVRTTSVTHAFSHSLTNVT